MLRKVRHSDTLPFLLLITLILVISYAVCIPKLSFYGDDWIYIYNYHIEGAKSFSAFTASDRPHSAWIYILTSAVFGESVICYHIFLFILRWLSVFLFWVILTDTFGDRKAAACAAILFGVYPGFRQQPIAVEFIMHFTSLVLVLLSIRLMQLACFAGGKRTIFLMAAGLTASLLAIFTCEYFFGLELARPFFLFFTLKHHEPEEKPRPLLKKWLKFTLPFILTTACFLFWRVFIFSFRNYQPKLMNALSESIPGGIRLIAGKIAGDLWTVLGAAYRQVLSRPSGVGLPAASVIFILCAIPAFLFFFREKRDGAEDRSAVSGMLILGIAVLLFSGIPFWGTLLDVTVSFPWDRSTLSFSPGAALLITACLQAALRPGFFCAAAAFLAALSALSQYQNGQVYIREAEKMNDYFWQMAWRAPGLAQGTIIASDEIPLDRYSDNDLTPIVNWQYSPEKRGPVYDYNYFDLDLREGFYYSDPGKTMPVEHGYRSHFFQSDTGKTLAVFYKKNGCLQIIDTLNSGYPGLPESIGRIASLSDPGLILTDPETPAVPPEAIGAEPEHGYCYYFQKISLARQTGDNETAHQLAAEALNADLAPVYAPDLAPVVLAFLQSGDISGAELMLGKGQIGSADRNYLCGYWMKSLPEDDGDLSEFYKSHGCL